MTRAFRKVRARRTITGANSKVSPTSATSLVLGFIRGLTEIAAKVATNRGRMRASCAVGLTIQPVVPLGRMRSRVDSARSSAVAGRTLTAAKTDCIRKFSSTTVKKNAAIQTRSPPT
jgi:hypothetical protein